MIVIDATDKIAGRVATYAAKQALLGEEVRIINSEKAVITGKKDEVFQKFLRRRAMGTPKGPHYPKRADRILRRIIRGMLPYKKPRGRDAFKRIKCYIGVPPEIKEGKAVNVQGSDVTKLDTKKYTDLGSISERLGAKIE